ncbi:protein SGT1 homolog [Fundulus heteroclitus]|uniref:protein SGT1 homolog n=1 Tax=Fundulus heteroclitus TaxID=8078 RepID=UPI00165BF5FC|nr:protein SGT1 homolog [Fundulus heteroclitus]
MSLHFLDGKEPTLERSDLKPATAASGQNFPVRNSPHLRTKPMAAERSFSDSFIDEDPQRALEALNEALQGDCDNAEWFCQRAYAHILLKNYSSAVDDAKKAQQLKPSLPLAFMRTGIAEYHLKNYESAQAAFSQVQQLDDSDKSFEVWIKRCEEMMGTQTLNGTAATTPDAHILLKNYSSAVDDAKKAQQLKPSLTLAFMRTGIAEYHLKNYESAQAAFSQVQQLDDSDKSFEVWIKRCEEMMGTQTLNGTAATQTPAAPPVKHDWYQTESQVIVTIMAKNVPKDGLRVSFTERELSAEIEMASGENCNLHFHLLHPIVPQQSSFKILTTKVEIKMKKTDAIRWEKLEGEGQESNIKHFNPNEYPTSSHYTKWDKVVLDISEEEKNEKLEGDAALNKLFQQIYSDGSDDVKRAMNKSFMESGGTVLSTNWGDVGTRKVDVKPPDDVEFKKVCTDGSAS